MPQGQPSKKQQLINKANSNILIVTSLASFVVIFSLVASFTLIGQLSYQNRVIGKKKVALTEVKKDLQNVGSLESSFEAFQSTTQNILGGNPSGTGAQDGDNSKIVLDALPSKYDFPALATSLEKILSSQNVTIQGISGTDDEVAQSAGSTSSSPQPVPVPFQIIVAGSYDNIKNVITTLQSSIRPIQVQTLDVSSGGENQLTLTIVAQTYYQPEKTLSIKKEVVK